MNAEYKGAGYEIYLLADRTLDVELCYPRNDETRINTVEVGLSDVRASDSVRITYDFERDGWSIKQASIFSWTADDPVCDADWQEVAFVKAWRRAREEDL